MSIDLENSLINVGRILAAEFTRTCESPIEVALLCALVSFDGQALFEPSFSKGTKSFAGCRGWSLYSQYEWEAYRLDFAVIGRAGKIAIECDGHDYHERTKEQAAHDRSRDRTLSLSGWSVLRFTGSEIYRDARRCVLDVVGMMAKLDGERVEEYLPRLVGGRSHDLAGRMAHNAEQESAERKFSMAVLGCLLDFPELLDDPEAKPRFHFLEAEVGCALSALDDHLRRARVSSERRALPFDLGPWPLAIDAETLLSHIPQSLQEFTAGRLASPNFESIREARPLLIEYLSKTERVHEARRLRGTLSILERSSTSFDPEGEAALREIVNTARKRRGIA